jgi:short-subunit dehydrogenase
MTGRPLAVVTGASSGIGYELARICAENGHDLVIAADRPIEAAAAALRNLGADVEAVQVDLATKVGVDRLLHVIDDRPVAALLANAGHGLGGAFLDQDFDQYRHVIDTNITGTIYLIQQVARNMAARNEGRILITGSIAGYLPGSFNAVYNGTKAFIDSFGWALRNELKDTEITVSILMPGATETEFFERADMEDTKIGTGSKDDAARVAQDGYDAMMAGEAEVVSGWKNKLQTTIANVTPGPMLAEMHRKQAEPGSGRK